MQTQPTAASGDEAPIRPKVMRRPAHFAGPSTALVAVPEVEETASLPAIRSESPHRAGWQEDSRFGLALISIVLLTNLLLLVGIPHTRLPQPTEQMETRIAVVEPVALSATPHREVTLYATPSGTRSPARLLSSEPLEGAAPILSVKPDEMPIPTARPLTAVTEE